MVWLLVIAASYPVGYYYQLHAMYEASPTCVLVTLGEGSLFVYRFPSPVVSTLPGSWDCTLIRRSDLPNAFMGFKWWFWHRSRPSGTTFVVPLWVLALPAIPVMWWSAKRRRSSEGLCEACGYDLRGLFAAPCPECGAVPIERDATAATPR